LLQLPRWTDVRILYNHEKEIVMMNEQAQRTMCEKHGAMFTPVKSGLKVGLAIGTLKLNPIYGVRESMDGDTTGWFIWGGPHSDAADFFQPVHVDHLAELLPIVLPFLGLEPGFKFITDRSGYEDVWRET
jgi:hypothetical protein